MDIEQKAVEIYALRSIEAEKLKLEERIRELEQKLKDCQQTIFHLQRDQERIAKAREILEEGRKHVLATVKYTDWGSFVRNALDALEGK